MMAAPAAAQEEHKATREPLLSCSYHEEETEVVVAAEHQQSTSPFYLQQELISLSRKLVGEALASFMVVFTILAVKVNLYTLESDGSASLLALGVAGGMATTVTIVTLGHVSGSHINPAVTVTYTLIKHFPLQLAPLYISVQLIGGIVASLVLEVVYKPQWSIVLVTPVGSALQAVVAEAVAGFLLLFVCASVATDTRAIGQFAGLAIGAVIALNIIIVGPISGGGINPARVLGPALVSWQFEDVWIYVVGPVVGGMLGALMYLLLRPEEMRKMGVHKEIDIKQATKSLSLRFRSNNSKLTAHTTSNSSV